MEKIGQMIMTVRIKFKIDVSMWDILKLRFMRADYARRIINHIVNVIERNSEK